jgi:hypothetical protein
MKPTVESPYFTPQEAAAFWRVSTWSVARWAIKLNWRTTFTPSGRIRYLREDVIRGGQVRVHNGLFKKVKAEAAA